MAILQLSYVTLLKSYLCLLEPLLGNLQGILSVYSMLPACKINYSISTQLNFTLY